MAEEPVFRWVFPMGGDQIQLSNGAWVNGSGILAIASDQDGNVLIAGNIFSRDPSFALPHATNLVPKGGFVAKLCPCGNLMWLKSVSTNASFEDVTTDGAGNVYAIGYTNLKSTGETGPTLPSNILLNKYDPQGNLIWSFVSQGGQVDIGCKVSVDASNNVCVTAMFSSTNLHLGAISLAHDFPFSPHYDQCLAKFDAAGKPIWAKTLSGAVVKPGFDRAGNIIVASTFDKPLTFGREPVKNTGPRDVFVAKFKPDGSVIWVNDVGVGEFSLHATSADANGNIFLGGTANGPTYSLGSYTLTNFTGFIAKIDTNGIVLWAKEAPWEYCVFADTQGNVYQLGNCASSDRVDFGGFKLTSPVNRLSYILKYDGSGNVVWATRAYGMEENSPWLYPVAADRWGSVYFSGKYNGPTVFGGLSFSSRYKDEGFLAKLEVLH